MDLNLIQGSSGNMETLTVPRSVPTDPAAEGAASRWVMLNRKIHMDSGSSATDVKTTAASCTSSGLPFSVSMSIAAPPEVSSFHYNLLGGEGTTPCSDDDDDKDTDEDLQLQIVAAHDDTVLIELRLPQPRHYYRCKLDYFLYVAVAGRKPTLFLLPGCYVSHQFERAKDARQVPTRSEEARNLSCFNNTGILRRGDGEVLVAQLEVGYDAPTELCVFHGPTHDWVLKGLPIVHHEGEGELQHRPEIDATVPIGSRFLCWVDYYTAGFILCDMAEENPARLRYVPLPVLPANSHYRDDRSDMQYCRNLAAAGPSMVRFVSVAPRCCCGGPGKTSCERSNFAFNVTTWTMNLKTEDPMVWVKDGVLDCDELWQLPNYSRLPRVAPRYPILSSDDPDVICFTVCEDHYFIDNADKTVWMFTINTRSKALLSVVRSDKEWYMTSDNLPAKLFW